MSTREQEESKLAEKRARVALTLSATSGEEYLAVDSKQVQAEKPARKMTMLEIAGVVNELLTIMEDASSEEEFNTTNELLQKFVKEDLANKVDAIGWADREMDMRVYALQNEIRLYEEQIGRINRQKMRMRTILQSCLQIMGQKNIKGNVSSIRVLDGKESLNVVDEKLVPMRYFDTETVYVRNNQKIKSDLKAKLLVPGAELKTGDPTISILPKFKKPAVVEEARPQIGEEAE